MRIKTQTKKYIFQIYTTIEASINLTKSEHKFYQLLFLKEYIIYFYVLYVL